MNRLAVVLVLAALLAAVPGRLSCDETQERRSSAGARLFWALLAADLDLANKTCADGSLLVVVFYTTDREEADRVTAILGSHDENRTIRTLPVRIEATDDPGFSAYKKDPPAGIFLAQAPSTRDLRAVIRYGIQHRVIVYSPFEGHVEQGVLAGLSVGARVQPYVNRDTLDASHIHLKGFFLKVTKVYP